MIYVITTRSRLSLSRPHRGDESALSSNSTILTPSTPTQDRYVRASSLAVDEFHESKLAENGKLKLPFGTLPLNDYHARRTDRWPSRHFGASPSTSA